MENPLDPELLRRLMLGDYSGSTDRKASEKRKSAIKRSTIQEIDLHLVTLKKQASYQADLPALEQQLQMAEEAFKQAIKQSCVALILIHGHGESVLRDALYKRYKNRKEVLRLEHLLEPPYSGAALKLHLK